jgi:hypothetical protein
MIQAAVEQLTTPTIIILEAYRVFNGAMLVIFVPGVCGERACTPIQNFTNGSLLYRIVSVSNIVMLFFFIALYAAEIRRENRLKHYLLVNHQVPTDAETVAKALEKLPDKRKQQLYSLNDTYRKIVGSTIAMFVINTVLSGYVIGTEYSNDKGPILFVTGTVLIANKMYDMFSILNAGKDVFLSAYTKQKVQFNDVQPTKAIQPV